MTASNRRKLLGAIAAAGIVSAALLALMNKPKPRPAARAEVPVAANPAADRAHEMKSLEAELQKKPDHAPILFRMAQLARELGKPAEAAQHLEQILKAEPDHPEALLELGRTLFESGDVQGAIARTNRLLAINPTQVDALYNLGAIYGNLNQPDQARQYWQRAVAAGPASESGLRAKESLARLSQ